MANAYPSEAAIYRNGFLHRRVLAYREAGVETEVFYLHPPATESYEYEYEGVRVVVGDARAYERHIGENSYDSYMIHFATPSMVRPLRTNSVTSPITIWIHGFEAESWHRRWFNFVSDPATIRAAVRKKREYYDAQLAFMRELYTDDSLDLRIVNVSKWFQNFVVEPDAGVELSHGEVIPNFIDDKIFEYRPKLEDDRLKILSIRPYASRKYANDLTVKAIQELATRPYFSRLQFTLYGEGALFHETIAPLDGFDNVAIHNRFLAQAEIPNVHGEHGIFLTPTRFDSQGVSMCEAMSSGLVPVGTDVSAISEFVADGVSGLLAPSEDAIALADQVERLYFNPELYLRLSAAATESVRASCGRGNTIERELLLIQRGVRRA
ncbi:glycosyltransferase family 4 protein [Intrasporangium calvum]|uniref:Glycosyltransferase family 4 protein n=1 Tax=Intrasporangium calvum TaxID=53358 RepID=A0ABT5GJC9_9MICO|nr:glycosyltransferase family 4 protein [Intrasporangium calvum]MDC5698352.1 glycosyltransferase family 4 protein [Intrasporangium calvum]